MLDWPASLHVIERDMAKDALKKGIRFQFTRPGLPSLKARIERMTRLYAVVVYRDDGGKYQRVWMPRGELAAQQASTV